MYVHEQLSLFVAFFRNFFTELLVNLPVKLPVKLPVTPPMKLSVATTYILVHVAIMFSPMIFAALLYLTASMGTVWFIASFLIATYIHMLEFKGEHRKKVLPKIMMHEPNDGACEMYDFDKVIDATTCTVSDNVVLCVAPHGPTVYPVMGCFHWMYYKLGVVTKTCVASAMMRLPMFNGLISSITELIDVAPQILDKAFAQSSEPYCIYVGGFNEVFANCNTPNEIVVVVNSKSRFYEMAIKHKKKLVPVLVLDELDYFKHPKLIVRIFWFIHKKMFRCGIPIPVLGEYCLPLYLTKKIKLVCGDPIDATSYSNGIDLCNAYMTELKNIHERSMKQFTDIKPLTIVEVGGNRP